MSIIFKNIEFHNVEELELYEDGYRMSRIPRCVAEKVNERIRNVSSWYSTGVELRFKLKSDTASIVLRAAPGKEAQVAYLYYGSIQGGWEFSSKAISNEETKITVQYPKHMNVLEKVSRENNLPFDPYVVRIILPYGTCYFIDVIGEVEAPTREEEPLSAYLAYGSSITHGSLALTAPSSYPFQIAQRIGCDYYNLGFAGTAYIEKEMAEYIISRKDWDFASVELGINLINAGLEDWQFEHRISEFLDVLSKEVRPIFVTDIFGFLGAEQKRAERYREIVSRHIKGRFKYITGTDLLNNPVFVSADLTHPTLEGIHQIACKWGDIMLEGQRMK